MWILCWSVGCSSWSQGTNVVSVSFLHVAVLFSQYLQASITVKLNLAWPTHSKIQHAYVHVGYVIETPYFLRKPELKKNQANCKLLPFLKFLINA